MNPELLSIFNSSLTNFKFGFTCDTLSFEENGRRGVAMKYPVGKGGLYSNAVRSRCKNYFKEKVLDGLQSNHIFETRRLFG